MKKKAEMLLLLLIIAIALSNVKVPYVIGDSETTTVRFISEVTELGPENATGTEFLVAVVIEDVENLYGLSVKVYINETYFEYIEHTTTIPWNISQTPVPPSPYAGILYAEVWPVKDEYNPDTHVLEISYSSMAPAPPFNGSGTVCVFKLKVINHPRGGGYIDVIAAKFIEVKLAGYGLPPPPIPYTSEDLIIRMNCQPAIDIIAPTTNEPVYTQSGKPIPVTYNYTEDFPKNVTITVFNATYIIATATITDLESGPNIQRTDDVIIPATVAEGVYSLNVTLCTLDELSVTATQADAIVVDNTKPSITNIVQSPPSDNVQPTDTVKVNATITDNLSPIKKVILKYSTDGGTTWIEVPMAPITGNIYTATIPQKSYCTYVHYMVVAEDNAGNIQIENNAGEYYVYHVIPEFNIPVLVAMALLIPTIAMVILKRKNPSK